MNIILIEISENTTSDDIDAEKDDHDVGDDDIYIMTECLSVCHEK